MGLADDPAAGRALDALDRNLAAEALVPGPVHGAVAAGADPFTNGESAQDSLAFDHRPLFAAS
jgi:hypothetical protein